MTDAGEPVHRVFHAAPTDHILPVEPFPGSAQNPGRCPDHVLAELLALNEEMIEQLQGERLSVQGTAAFIVSMIAQHEKAAALLRAQLRIGGANPV